MRYDRNLNILSIAIQNLKYRLARTNIMIFFIIALVFSIFTSTILSLSMQNGIIQTSERLGADIIVVPKEFSNSMKEALFLGEPCTFTFGREWVTKCQNVKGVERITTQLYLSTLTDSCCDSQIQLIAIDPKNDFIIQPWIAQKTKSKLSDNEMVIGNNINLNVGDKAKFFGKYFLVLGKLTKTGMGYDNCIFINYNDAYRLMEVLNKQEGETNKINNNLISMVLIDVKDDYDINNVYEELNKSYKNYVSVLKANSMFSEISKNIKSYSKFGDIFLSILFVISTIAILSIFTITINQRKKELIT